MPRGLNRLKFCFVGFRGIAGKTRELGNPFVHVRKADCVRIEIGEFISQRDSDVFHIIPIEGCGHDGSLENCVCGLILRCQPRLEEKFLASLGMTTKSSLTARYFLPLFCSALNGRVHWRTFCS